jgi:glycosyltransferase involved in cell wall biosynthesis
VYKRQTLNCAKDDLSKIRLTGKINKQKVIQFYHIADIGIIPSVFEQCSYVALEMMQYGLPVAVANAPGLNELYINYKNALIAPLTCNKSVILELQVIEEELERLIEKLLTNKNLRRIISLNARKYWETSYTANIMGAKTLKIYKEL